MRLPRKEKKKLRAIFLCHTGNSDCRKSKYSKRIWVQQKEYYKVWFKCFDMTDRKLANLVKWKPKN